MKIEDIIDSFREQILEAGPLLKVSGGVEGDGSIPGGLNFVGSLVLKESIVAIFVDDWYEDGAAIPTQFCMDLAHSDMEARIRATLESIQQIYPKKLGDPKMFRVAAYRLEIVDG